MVSGKAEQISLNCTKCSGCVVQFEGHEFCQTLGTVFTFFASELITSLAGKFLKQQYRFLYQARCILKLWVLLMSWSATLTIATIASKHNTWVLYKAVKHCSQVWFYFQPWFIWSHWKMNTCTFCAGFSKGQKKHWAFGPPGNMMSCWEWENHASSVAADLFEKCGLQFY